MKEFVANPYNDENLPEKQKKRIPYFDEIMVTSNHKITVQKNAKTTELDYQVVMDAIRAAYKELREDLANEKVWERFCRMFLSGAESYQSNLSPEYSRIGSL